MTVSVGLGKIINDPDASILTRKALGALSNPNLIVTDKGLTIDNSGRMVLRLTPNAGLTEDGNGLSIKLAPAGGLTVDANGLAVADVDVVTCNTLIVNANASVGGTMTAGAVISTGSVSGVSATFSGTGVFGDISVTGAMNAGSAAISGNVSIVGTLTVSTLSLSNITVSGNASVGGTLTAGTFAPSSISTGSLAVSGNASVGGTLTAGTFAPSSISTGTLAVSGNATVGGTLTATTAVNTANSTVSGNIDAGSLTTTGSLGVGLGGGNFSIAGGTGVIRLLSFYGSISVPNDFGTLDFTINTPGVVSGDLVVCSADGTPDVTFDSWSCAVYANDYVTIRVYRDGLTTYPAVTLYFRIMCVGFL